MSADPYQDIWVPITLKANNKTVLLYRVVYILIVLGSLFAQRQMGEKCQAHPKE